MVIVECKNYSKDIANPEIDQLLGRFDDNRGYFGFIACRRIDNKTLLLKKCQDLSRSRKAFIIVLGDSDLIELLDARRLDDNKRLEGLLHAKFAEIIS